MPWWSSFDVDKCSLWNYWPLGVTFFAVDFKIPFMRKLSWHFNDNSTVAKFAADSLFFVFHAPVLEFYEFLSYLCNYILLSDGQDGFGCCHIKWFIGESLCHSLNQNIWWTICTAYSDPDLWPKLIMSLDDAKKVLFLYPLCIAKTLSQKTR